MEHGKLKY